MRILIIIFCIFGITICFADELSDYLDNLNYLSTNFKQTIVDQQGEVISNAFGSMELRKPNLLRWEISEPDPSTIVSNGEKIWHLDLMLDQMTITNISKDKQQTHIAEILAGNTKLLNEHFDVTKENCELACFKIVPKNNDYNYSKIIISIDNQQLSKLKIYDQLGQISTFEFSNQSNAEIATSRFTLVPPDGIDVVEIN